MEEEQIISPGDFRDESLRKLMKKYLRHTCPIFIMAGKHNLQGHGTGVFVELGGLFFLITAFHVSDNQEVYIGIDGILEKLVGDELISISEGNDEVDLSIIQIPEKLKLKVKKVYEFVKLNEIRIDFSPESEKGIYTVHGYPKNYVKYHWNDKKIKARPFVYSTSKLETTVYDGEKNNINTHLIIAYNKKIRKEMHPGSNLGELPIPNGLSGGGLWFSANKIEYSNQFLNHGIPKYSLIGILNSRFDGRNYLRSTRIDLVIEAIREKYEIILPRSSFVSVKIIEEKNNGA